MGHSPPCFHQGKGDLWGIIYGRDGIIQCEKMVPMNPSEAIAFKGTLSTVTILFLYLLQRIFTPHSSAILLIFS